MAVKQTLTLASVVIGALAIAGCSTTAEKQILSDAYQYCKSRTGEARDRCIKSQQQALRLKQFSENEACLEEINEQDDRAAMIDGRRTADTRTEAASSLCGALVSQPN